MWQFLLLLRLIVLLLLLLVVRIVQFDGQRYGLGRGHRCWCGAELDGLVGSRGHALRRNGWKEWHLDLLMRRFLILLLLRCLVMLMLMLLLILMLLLVLLLLMLLLLMLLLVLLLLMLLLMLLLWVLLIVVDVELRLLHQLVENGLGGSGGQLLLGDAGAMGLLHLLLGRWFRVVGGGPTRADGGLK